MIKYWILVLIMTFPYNHGGPTKKVGEFDLKKDCNKAGIYMMAYREKPSAEHGHFYDFMCVEIKQEVTNSHGIVK